jgi:hypothetical protein
LFAHIKRDGNQKWSKFFKAEAALINDKMINFNKIQTKAKGMIADISEKTSFNLLNLKGGENTTNQNKLRNAIDALLSASDFSELASTFITNTKYEFKKSLSVESITTLEDTMPLILETWYRENGFTFSENDDADQVAEEDFENYFSYPEGI